MSSLGKLDISSIPEHTTLVLNRDLLIPAFSSSVDLGNMSEKGESWTLKINCSFTLKPDNNKARMLAAGKVFLVKKVITKGWSATEFEIEVSSKALRKVSFQCSASMSDGHSIHPTFSEFLQATGNLFSVPEVSQESSLIK